jgi:hypothetical protein
MSAGAGTDPMHVDTFHVATSATEQSDGGAVPTVCSMSRVLARVIPAGSTPLAFAAAVFICPAGNVVDPMVWS